ncbi:MAG TPA: hypothetical protein VF744_17320 [Beijerinckiaceae bacterium]|jgi:hypothetical protein
MRADGKPLAETAREPRILAASGLTLLWAALPTKRAIARLLLPTLMMATWVACAEECTSERIPTFITHSIDYPDPQMLENKTLFVFPSKENENKYSKFFNRQAIKFFKSRSTDQKVADFFLNTHIEWLPTSSSRYSFPPRSAKFVYIISLCPNQPIELTVGIGYKCFWKYFETAQACPMNPILAYAVLNQVLRRESTVRPIPNSAVTQTVTVELPVRE